MKTFEKKTKPATSPVRRRRTPVPPSFDAAAQIQRAQIRQVLRPLQVQTKLTIGQPIDIYEQEADRVAEEVMRMPEPQVQRQAEEEEEEEEILQTKENPGQTPEVTPDLESHIQSLRGRGQPLSESVRAFFEPHFGYDFSRVRIHTDTESDRLNRSINARSFTTGKDMFFRHGEYNLSSSSGRELLAHEMTHVVQQNNERIRRNPTISQPNKYKKQADHVLWQEKEIAAARADEALVQRANKEEEKGELVGEEKEVEPKKTGEKEGKLLGEKESEGTLREWEQQVNEIKENIEERLGLIRACRKLTSPISTQLKQVAEFIQRQYSRLYGEFKRKLSDAGAAEEQIKEAVVGIVLGIVIGVAVSYALPALFPALVVLRKAMLAISVLAVAGEEAVSEVLGELVEGVAQEITSGPSAGAILERTVPVGTMTQGTLGALKKISEALGKWEEWEQLESERTKHTLTIIYQHVHGGSSKWKRGELRKRVETLKRYHMYQPTADELRTMFEMLNEFKDKKLYEEPRLAKLIDEDRMRQDIRIMWMSSLDPDKESDRDIVDTMEGHLENMGILGPNSRLCVEFPWHYTSEENIKKAISEAKWEAGKIRYECRKARLELETT